MQERQYDAMLEGKNARWVPGGLVTDGLTKAEIEKEFEVNEVDVPDEKLAEIKEFITRLKKLNVKPREIYRRVKTRFDITVK